MAKGTVKCFHSFRGFGSIVHERGGKDVFVHNAAVDRAGLTGLTDARKVTFDVEAGRHGRESAASLALARPRPPGAPEGALGHHAGTGVQRS